MQTNDSSTGAAMTWDDQEAMDQSPLLRVAREIESAQALDPLVDAGQRVAQVVTSNPRVRRVLRGVPAGHPLHPVAVLIPIGVGVVTAAPATAAGLAAIGASGYLGGHMTYRQSADVRDEHHV